MAAAVTLTSDLLEATFLPDLGMLGASLRHRGDELLALPGGVEGYRSGDVTGLPLLAPWANRLGARRYRVRDVVVDLDGLDLHPDERGRPIHGTMTAQPGWVVAGATPRALSTRFDFGARPDLLASFPFPHELAIDARVDGAVLTITTTLVATGDRAVPVAFGYHPYFRLPGVSRPEVGLGLPARRHLELDEHQLPTGSARVEAADDAPLASRTFDDHYELADDRELSLSGGGRRLVVSLDEGYRYAQVFAPPAADFVCLEPMTAPVNALVDGGYALVSPGGSYTARYSIRVDDHR